MDCTRNTSNPNVSHGFINSPETDAYITKVQKTRGGIFISGAIVIKSGSLHIPVNDADLVSGGLSMTVKVSFSNLGFGITSSSKSLNDIKLVYVGQLLRKSQIEPQLYSHVVPVNGSGELINNLAHLYWKNCLPPETIALLPGSMLTFSFVLVNNEKHCQNSQTQIVTIAEYNISTMDTDINNSIEYDPLCVDPLLEYADKSLRISDDQLDGLYARLDNGVKLRLRNLYVIIANVLSQYNHKTINIGTNLIIQGQVTISCDYQNSYVFGVDSDNSTWSTDKTLPSLIISGTVFGDVQFISTSVLSSVAILLHINGGKLYGRVKTTYSDVFFLQLRVDNEGYIGEGSDLHVGLSYTTQDGKATFKDEANDANSCIITDGIYNTINANIITNCKTVLCYSATMNDIRCIFNGPSTLGIANCAIKSLYITVTNTDIQKAGNFKLGISESKIDNCYFSATCGEQLFLFDNTINNYLGMNYDDQPPTPTQGSDIDCLILLKQLKPEITQTVGCLRINDYLKINIVGNLLVKDLKDYRKTAQACVSILKGAVTITNMNYTVTCPFPLVVDDDIETPPVINMLSIPTADAPYELSLDCGKLKIQNLIDRVGKCTRMHARNVTINKFTTTSTDNFDLVSYDSKINFGFDDVSDPTKIFQLIDVRGSEISVIGRIVTNSTGVFDSSTYLFIPFGSNISFGGSRTILTTEDFKDIVFTSVCGINTTIVLPDSTDTASRRSLQLTSVLNKSDKEATVAIGGKSFNLLPSGDTVVYFGQNIGLSKIRLSQVEDY